MNNPEIELARQYVEFTGQNVFLTGRAGTGKTTFLRTLKQDQPKRMVVVAPTGVAAINAGGVTIHSFFQIAPGLFTTESKNNRYRMSEQKKHIMRTLDLLVIDEISMVRCDLLDAIDTTLRSYRDRSKPFGGVQVLFIGDLQQLSPVAKDNEWEILKNQYDTPYFFSAKVMRQTSFVTIELKQVYRQADPQFINLLSQIRTNSLSRNSLEELNRCHRPNFEIPEDEDWIYLTTHNSTADSYNERRLDRLGGNEHKFVASVSRDFPESSYPTDTCITLRIGAQVMFIKNDTSGRHGYYNGKIGKVTGFVDDDKVKVECKGDSAPIVVTAATWTNTRYDIDAVTGELHETTEGSFCQIPLRLAWAITIHKSQGLTFDRAVIDVSHSFAHGQTYVALSRCRSLRGLVLSKPLSDRSVICDSRVEHYVGRALTDSTNSAEHLPAYKRSYFTALLDELFGFDKLNKALSRMYEEAKHYANALPNDFVDSLEKAERLFRTEMTIYSRRFAMQYTALADDHDPTTDEPLQKRIKAASQYFLSQLRDNVMQLLHYEGKTIRTKEGQKHFANAKNELVLTFKIKAHTLYLASREGMTVKSFLNGKAAAETLTIDRLFGNATNTTDGETTTTAKSAKTRTTKKKTSNNTPDKQPTHHITLQLFNQGLTIEEIAAKRDLKNTTIESHIARLVGEGKVDIHDFVTPEHQELVRKVLRQSDAPLILKEIKDTLPPEITYLEIKAVMEYDNNNNN